MVFQVDDIHITFHRGSFFLDMSWVMPVSYGRWEPGWLESKALPWPATASWNEPAVVLKQHLRDRQDPINNKSSEKAVNPESLREESTLIAVFDVDQWNVGFWKMADSSKEFTIVYTKKLQTAYCNIQILQFNGWVPWIEEIGGWLLWGLMFDDPMGSWLDAVVQG